MKIISVYRISIMRAVLLCTCLALLAGESFAQTTAKGGMRGKVTDSKTKEALPGVNITIKGTYYGAASDFDGNFVIKSINPGSYTVEASLLGYKTVQFTNIKVTAADTTKLDVNMEE